MGAFEGHWVTGEDKMGDLCQGLVTSHSSLSPPAHLGGELTSYLWGC